MKLTKKSSQTTFKLAVTPETVWSAATSCRSRSNCPFLAYKSEMKGVERDDYFNDRAGMPTTVLTAAISDTTTAFAPITTSSPIVIGPMIFDPVPI